MARPPNTDERRQQITAGLMQVMARRGYEGASVASIAEAAGIGQGLVHYHFRSKQEILLELLAELVARHEGRLDELLGDPGCPAAQGVERFIEAHLGLGTADPDALACWILLSGEALCQPAVQAPYAAALGRLVDRLQSMISEGTRRGELGCRDAREAATAIIAAIQGYFVLAATARDLVPAGSAARSVQSMASGLLGPAEPRPPVRPPSRRGPKASSAKAQPPRRQPSTARPATATSSKARPGKAQPTKAQPTKARRSKGLRAQGPRRRS